MGIKDKNEAEEARKKLFLIIFSIENFICLFLQISLHNIS